MGFCETTEISLPDREDDDRFAGNRTPDGIKKCSSVGNAFQVHGDDLCRRVIGKVVNRVGNADIGAVADTHGKADAEAQFVCKKCERDVDAAGLSDDTYFAGF